MKIMLKPEKILKKKGLNIMKPIELFSDAKELVCEYCGKNIMENPKGSIIVLVEELTTNTIKDVYVCCKGECDNNLKYRIKSGEIDGWQDITAFINPLTYWRKVFGIINNLHSSRIKFDDEAFKKYKDFLISTAPYVCREITEGDKINYHKEVISEL